MSANPLDSVIFITLPDDYELPKEALKIDTCRYSDNFSVRTRQS